MSKSLTCPLCPRKFKTSEALHQHQRDYKRHPYCERCQRTFANLDKLFDHTAVAHGKACISCRRLFPSITAVESHLYGSSKHPKCIPCRIGFQDSAARNAHNTEVHRNPGPNAKGKGKERPLSPSSNTEYCPTPSSTLQPHSPPTSVTSLNSGKGITPRTSVGTSQKELNGSFSSNGSAQNASDTPDNASLQGLAGQLEKEDQVSSRGSTRSHQAQKNDPEANSSPHLTGNSSPSAAVLEDFITELREINNINKNPQDRAYTDVKIDLPSPVLKSRVSLPSDSSYNVPGARGDIPDTVHFTGQFVDHRLSPRLDHVSANPASAEALDYSTKTGQTSPRHARSRSSTLTAQTFFQLSSLPTISDEPEFDQEEEPDYNSELLGKSTLDAPLETLELKLPTRRRKRRLSLSPNLPSIPETPVSHGTGYSVPVNPDDSGSDSSQGIYEHRAGDFLYDGFSDDERSQTPMTYLTPDELDLNIDTEKDNEEICPPLLFVEDLSRLMEEMSPPSTADSEFFDPSTDPFDLHPSANNSPMSATFPKRPRAWSLSAPNTDGNFLSPEVSRSGSKDTAGRGSDGVPENVLTLHFEMGEEGPDETAISADEPPPTIIEEDLFSETDEIMELMLQDVHGIEPLDIGGEAQFAEEDHPLRSFISLDTLALDRRAPDNSNHIDFAVQSQPRSQEDHSDLPTNVEEREPTCQSKAMLRCRLCQVDPCREMTATFCGHIFCYECITQEVMAKSKCPVCNAPTLLYCLFKLDLNS